MRLDYAESNVEFVTVYEETGGIKDTIAKAHGTVLISTQNMNKNVVR